MSNLVSSRTRPAGAPAAMWPVRLGATLAALALLIVLLGGVAGAAPGPQAPTATCPPDGQCFADVPPGHPFFSFANDLYRTDIVSGYTCGGPGEPCDPYHRPYFRPAAAVTRGQMTKFADLARTQPGIHIDTALSGLPLFSRTSAAGGVGLYGVAAAGQGVRGESSAAGQAGVHGENNGGGYGVLGRSTGEGVRGESTGNADGVVGVSAAANRSGVYGWNTGNGYGVYGRSSGDGQGVFGESQGQDGVQGRSYSAADSGVYGLNLSGGFGIAGRSNGVGEKAAVFGENTGGGNAGYFAGNVVVTGTCCAAAAGSFRIDDPQDPANRYLYLAAVASPDMLDIYNGNGTTDAGGTAVVELPAYFAALNRDFRYQVTPIGQFAQVMIAETIKDNHFTIKTDKPHIQVSWQVTGIRADPYAEQYRVPGVQPKPADEHGYYLQPELYGQPGDQRVEPSLRRPLP